MALPAHTASILKFLFPLANSETDYVVVKSDSGVQIAEFNATVIGASQPTEQEIIDAGNDLTSINGQVFSVWFAEHGGDAVATLRRKAKEALDNQTQDTNALIRALALVVLDEVNILRGQHSLADRTASQIRTAIKNKIDSGDADT